jgi:hypothetical protein
VALDARGPDEPTFGRANRRRSLKEALVNALRSVALALVAATAVVAGSTAPAPAAAAAGTVTESFETDLGGWRSDTDGRARAWGITRSQEQARHGAYSLRVFMDGSLDDGTSWVERQFKVAPYATVQVTVDFHVWSSRQADIGTWLVVAAAGTRNPEAEADFSRLGATEQVAGWKPYGKTWTVTADAAGAVWVAVGTSVVWETIRHHYLDYVRVTIQPAVGAAPAAA